MVEISARQVEHQGIGSVIEHGFCVGCGACTAISNAKHEMILTPKGMLEARPLETVKIDSDVDQAASRVCPFSDNEMNEDILAAELFKEADVHEKLGRFISTYAGHVVEGEFRERGASGGMGSWLLEQLMIKGHVDAIVHVGELQDHEDGTLFSYKISRTVKEIRSGAKSRYYPVTLSHVMQEVIKKPGRYAFSGVPCFIKAIRLLAKENSSFGQSVTYCLGLVCGHLKSRGFSEFLAWQMGIRPSELREFDFRVKMDDQPANRYGALAKGVVEGEHIQQVVPMASLYGHDWGIGLFKLKACDYCDDVVSETADVTIGDAWLPRFVADSEGTNLLIVRNTTIGEIVREGVKSGALNLEVIDPEEVVQSQSSCYTHRREGLAYRLSLADSLGKWRPLKRIAPLVGHNDGIFERRHQLRMQLATQSHNALLKAKEQQDLGEFFSIISPIVETYRDLTRTPLKRVLALTRRVILGDAAIHRALKRNKVGDRKKP